MIDFFNEVGKLAIGSRLRMLTDKITEDAVQVYELFGVDLNPKWFPVFHTLSQGDYSITEIAQKIGHSHPSVSKIVGEMSKKSLIIEKRDKNDARRNILSLSKRGREMREKLEDQLKDVGSTVEQLLDSTQNNLWKAIEEWEYLLEQKSFYKRVLEQKKQREGKDIKIVAFEDKYAEAFRDLNVEWISTYFKMEEADHKSLDYPQKNIINKGGEILVALYKDEPVGVCALIKMNDPKYDYELAKMAVSPLMQGKGVGFLLGNAVIARAKELGAKNLYLESNTKLKPAINLYNKLGFRKVAGRATPYERCNIQMELIF